MKNKKCPYPLKEVIKYNIKVKSKMKKCANSGNFEILNVRDIFDKNFNWGDIVLVSDNGINWFERVFVAINPANRIKRYVVCQPNNNGAVSKHEYCRNKY